MKVLLLISAVIAVSQAHLCLLSPQQRGNITGLNMQGSDNCLLVKDPPCGGRMEEMPMTTFKAGMNATIIFQKNLDHWYSTNPGMFQINFWEGVKKQTLMEIPDTNTPSGTLYTVNVKMPDMEAEKAILQVVYVTSNPMAPAEFYQCADIRNMK